MGDLSKRKLDFISELALIQDESAFSELEKTMQRIRHQNGALAEPAANAGAEPLPSPEVKPDFESSNNDKSLASQKQKLRRLARPIRKKLDIEEIKREQGWKGYHDKAAIFKLIREMDVQEPIELLLSQLTK